MSSTLVVRPEITPATLRHLDGQAEYWTHAASSSRDSEDGAHYANLAAGLQSLAAHVRAGQAMDLTSRLETMTAGEWLIEQGVKYEVQRAWESSEWDWRYLSDLATLAADIEATTGEMLAAA
jgi:hypothetical protein